MAHVVIVGSSIGGVRTAQALRRAGFDGAVTIIGAEPHLPYDKPPLSKQFLGGSWDLDRLTLLTAEQAEKAEITLRLGVAARGLDVETRTIALEDATTVGYDVLVIATGSSARPSPWQAESGVHVLRTLDDSLALREALRPDGPHPGPVVVVGGGFIGAEVSATVRALGRDVTVVDPLPAPIGRVIGPEIGIHFTALHERHGTTTRFGVGVEAVEGTAGDLVVRLADGTELEAATVVAGIGAVPNIAWLDGSGLAIDHGVLCDERGRATGTSTVYAVGDVARWLDQGTGHHRRTEHWTSAVDQAAAVARDICGVPEHEPEQPLDYVWSDQYDWKIQLIGRPGDGTRTATLGSLTDDPARAAVLHGDHDGRLVGATIVNWPKAGIACRRLVRAGAQVDEARTAIEPSTAGVPT